MPRAIVSTRRSFIAASACATLALPLTLRPSGAATPGPTPRQSEGPFYPDALPLDRDSDLLVFNGKQAMGQPADVSGRVLDARGQPLGGVSVEIWQCDALGYYKHVRGQTGGDPHFQGYGRTTAADDGSYRFQTIRPVPYGARTPHIHFKLRGRGIDGLTTQLYIAGHARNAQDFLFTRIPERLRARVTAAFEPGPDTEVATARFDIVLGPDFVSDHDG
jgi:protocatechuate 3,4-dioxygenase beta subunit